MPLKRTNQPTSVSIQLRVRLPFLWLGVCFVAAFLLPDRVWNTLLIGIGGMFLVGYIWVWQLSNGLSANRQVQFGWVAVGDRLEELFILKNKAPLPAIWVEVLDQANVPGYRPAVVRSVGERQEIRWRESAVCQQRGQYRLGPWRIRTSDPFGLFMLTLHYPIADEIIIHPPINTHIPIPIPTGQSSGRTRRSRQSQLATLNASSIRPYQPLDSYSRIHWPAVARHNDLFVKTFDLDAAGAVWICLDLRPAVQLGEGLDGTEEHAVVWAAALSAQAIFQNRPIGLAAYGRHPQIVPPALGVEHRWRILRALALVRADSDVPLSTALIDLGQMARRDTAVVLITPDYQVDWMPQLMALKQKGIRPYVTLLERQSFGGLEGNTAVQEQIHLIGGEVQIVRQGDLALVQQPSTNNLDFIVTGTGKVVLRQPT